MLQEVQNPGTFDSRGLQGLHFASKAHNKGDFRERIVCRILTSMRSLRAPRFRESSSRLLVPGRPKELKIMDPVLAILSILRYWAILLGTLGFQVADPNSSLRPRGSSMKMMQGADLRGLQQNGALPLTRLRTHRELEGPHSSPWESGSLQVR